MIATNSRKNGYRLPVLYTQFRLQKIVFRNQKSVSYPEVDFVLRSGFLLQKMDDHMYQDLPPCCHVVLNVTKCN